MRFLMNYRIKKLVTLVLFLVLNLWNLGIAGEDQIPIKMESVIRGDTIQDLMTLSFPVNVSDEEVIFKEAESGLCVYSVFADGNALSHNGGSGSIEHGAIIAVDSDWFVYDYFLIEMKYFRVIDAKKPEGRPVVYSIPNGTMQLMVEYGLYSRSGVSGERYQIIFWGQQSALENAGKLMDVKIEQGK